MPTGNGRQPSRPKPDQPVTEGAPLVFRRRERLDIQVGLDFGTSSTKAVYREIGTPTEARRVVDFGTRSREYPSYCCPNVGAIDGDGSFLWGWDASRTPEFAAVRGGIRRLKVVVAGTKETRFRDVSLERDFQEYLWGHDLDPSWCPPEYVAAMALAQQMGAVRQQLRVLYGGTELDIRFNVCVPVEHVEHSPLLRTYHQIGHVAEQLLCEPPAANQPAAGVLDWVATRFETADPDERTDGRVFMVPESVAQIACYLTSLEARSGLHGVVEIGAGTTDVGIFNLWQDAAGDETCYWFAAANIPMGGAIIEQRVSDRLASLASGGALLPDRPALVQQLFGEPGPEVLQLVRRSLEDIHRATKLTWAKSYGKYKKYKRVGAWNGIPVFLTGGASRWRAAQPIFAGSWVPNQIEPHAIRGLPRPRQLEAGHDVDFARLAVAFGLTYAKPELSEFRLPNDTRDQTPEIRWRMGSASGNPPDPPPSPWGGANEEGLGCAGRGRMEPLSRSRPHNAKKPAHVPGRGSSLDPFIQFQMRETTPVSAPHSRPASPAPLIRCFCGNRIVKAHLRGHLEHAHGLSAREAQRNTEALLRNARYSRPKAPPFKRVPGPTATSCPSPQPRSSPGPHTAKNRWRPGKEDYAASAKKPSLVALSTPGKCGVCGRATTVGRRVFGRPAVIPVCRECA